MISIEKNTLLIKKIASELGFDSCGIAIPIELYDDALKLEKWLKNGYQAGMQYMERNFDLRINPLKLVPEARSVITLLFNYFPNTAQNNVAPKISKYAWGTDYHIVIKNKLHKFIADINKEIGNVSGRGFVDSAPVLERSWAVKSGLGWIGKNGNLITKKSGSYFFIATLITDLKLIPDLPFVTDHCGSCRRCIDSCPTGAIVSPKVIDSNRCISYQTIELKDTIIAPQLQPKLEGWIFGCDVCQDVCPWNKFAKPHTEELFTPIKEILFFTEQQWELIGEDTFNKLFKYSPLKRAKWQGLMRNLKAIKSTN